MRLNNFSISTIFTNLYTKIKNICKYRYFMNNSSYACLKAKKKYLVKSRMYKMLLQI